MAEPIDVHSQTVPLDSGQPERTQVGRLHWRGGLSLSSSDPRFGGLSDLQVGDGGSSVTMISDEGWRLDGRLVYDSAGWLAGVADFRIADLTGPQGAPLVGKELRDAEALVVVPDGARIVAFEQRHRLLRYPAGGGPPRPLVTPPGMEAAPANAGLEALTRLADGRLLGISEGLETQGGNAAWIGDGSRWQRRVWRTDPGFRPTGAASLPGGDVLVLERMFPPPAARVRLLRAQTLDAPVLDGEEIARFVGSLTYDNMEGIATVPTAAGETLVFLLSDDNYSPIQQTLLLLFRLEP